MVETVVEIDPFVTEPLPRRAARLAMCLLVVAIVWCGLLPFIGNLPSVRDEIAERQRQGIDASAMFYTELEMMDGVIQRNQQFHREHPDALWVPSFGTGEE